MNVIRCKTLIKCHCNASKCTGYMGISNSQLKKYLKENNYTSEQFKIDEAVIISNKL